MRISDWSSDVCSSDLVGTTVLDSSHWNFFDADVLSWKVSQGFDAHFRHDLTQVRLALEPAAAAEAAERRSDEDVADLRRSEEHTSELQSLMRISYAVFCLKKKKTNRITRTIMTIHPSHT